MEILSGAEMIVHSLINQGIKKIFGYPGGAILDIYDVLHKNNNIHHILVRHEQSAVHMADGYARATGKIGVVLVTSGPGATNAITGIATAYMDSVPLIILSGQVASFLIGLDAFQECDMIGISRPIVKHSFLLRKTEDIPLILKKAFYLASNGRPGPIVIDIPKDILNPINKLPYFYPKNIPINTYHHQINNNKLKINNILKKLINAKKPVVYVGGGTIIAGCQNTLKQIVKKLNLPVVSSLMGLGSFPGNNEKNLGMLGMHGTFEANMTMHYADVILAIGVRFDDRTTNNLEKYCPNAKIFHIDIDPTSISKTVIADIAVIGDAKEILYNMLQILKKIDNLKLMNNLSNWWKCINEWKSRKCLRYSYNKDKIKPQTVIEILYYLTKGKAYITSDVGQHQMFVALYYLFNKPRRWISSGGLGTMGFGLPAALGVKMAFPKETVICITGDGSIQMNIQELSTASQYNLPIIIINMNNNSLGMVKQWQDMIYFGRHSQSYMKSLPNFVKLAEAYGHIGMIIKKPYELKNKLNEALQIKNHLVFIDIIIDDTEHVYPMQVRGGGMNEMWLNKTDRT